jgi:alpha-glucoside transport system permease protein
MVVMVAAFAAYAFAWMEFRGRDWLFVLLVGLLVIPLQVTFVPIGKWMATFTSVSGIPLQGTFLGIWLAHTGFGLPLAVFLLYNFISQLPEDLFETASIDGATHFQKFTRVVLPLSVPALAAFAIFQFMWVWNDLLVALVFLGPQDNVAVATVKLTQLVGNRGEQWHVLTAAAFISMILPLLVFLALQRYFIRGILAGSVKG